MEHITDGQDGNLEAKCREMGTRIDLVTSKLSEQQKWEKKLVETTR